ncbi:MAG TPA: transposase [Actinoplanes sp.]|nr:transposase [Actinoplanes sp.]
MLTRLDAALLSAVLAGGLRSRTPPAPVRPHRHRTVIAIDGKTLRGARLREGRQTHLLSALDTGTGIVLAQVTVDTTSNEIPAFTPLLTAVESVLGSLAGVLFVADAMHNQTDHAEQITRPHQHRHQQLHQHAMTLHRGAPDPCPAPFQDQYFWHRESGTSMGPAMGGLDLGIRGDSARGRALFCEGDLLKIRYFLDEKELNGPVETRRTALAQCAVTCTVNVAEQLQEVRGFRKDGDFEGWVRGQPFAAKVEETKELVARSRVHESQDAQRVVDRQRILNQRTVEDLMELSQRLDLAPTSRELLDLAHRGVSPLEPPILHSAVLFDNSPSGAVTFILPTGIPVPSFGGGNDRTSQVDIIAAAVTTLWDRTWWRGDSHVMFGVGFFSLFNSAFDNRAASGICL